MTRSAKSASASAARAKAPRASGPATLQRATSTSTPATGRDMTLRPWLLISALLFSAPGLRADAGAEVHEMIVGMHAALLESKPDALRAFFDPKMPGFKGLSTDIGLLLKECEAPSSVEFVSNTGDESARDLDLDWRLELRT